MQLDLSNFVTWAFYAAVSGSVAYMIKVLWYLKDSQDQTRVQLAVMNEKHARHEADVELLRSDFRILRADVVSWYRKSQQRE